VEAVRCENLRKYYGNVHALDGLTLSVEQGAVFGFLGPNGAGKTTCIRILTGLAHHGGGRAWVAGVEVGAGQEQQRRIGYLPEEPAFYSWMRPPEYLEYVGAVFGMGAAERKARGAELLELAGLTDASKRRIGGFSRGMRQRLGLAQALVNRPEVLFLDEPVSALDPQGRKEVLSLIESLRGQCTVFMSTHILADVERVCDTVGIIAHGRLITEARREDLIARYATPAFDVVVEEGSAEALGRWVEGLAQVPWVQSISVEGPAAHLVVRDLERAKRELLGLVATAGLPVLRYEAVRPSIEDVFLRLTNEGGQE
jgi:ABC-2 type transport system ATP-binding protein